MWFQEEVWAYVSAFTRVADWVCQLAMPLPRSSAHSSCADGCCAVFSRGRANHREQSAAGWACRRWGLLQLPHSLAAVHGMTRGTGMQVSWAASVSSRASSALILQCWLADRKPDVCCGVQDQRVQVGCTLWVATAAWSTLPALSTAVTSQPEQPSLVQLLRTPGGAGQSQPHPLLQVRPLLHA